MRIVVDKNIEIISIAYNGIISSYLSLNGTYHNHLPYNLPLKECFVAKEYEQYKRLIEYVLFGIEEKFDIVPSKENPAHDHNWVGVMVDLRLNGKECHIFRCPPHWQNQYGVKKFLKENISFDYDGKYYFWESNRKIEKFAKEVLGIIKK